MNQQSNEIGVSSLPPEMIEKIFEYLTVPERLTASLTCKEWHQLAFSPKFCEKLWIRIDYRKRRLASLRKIRTYQKFRHAYIDLANIRKSKHVAKFLRTAPLESLKIHLDRKSIKEILDDFLPCMNALTKLHIIICGAERLPDDTVGINHPNLKSVSIVDKTNNEKFEINCPNLMDLTLEVNFEININVVTQLQHLQCLEFSCYRNHHIKALENAKLSNLRKLHLNCGKSNKTFGSSVFPSFDCMVNLRELQLFSQSCDNTTIGEQLAVLTRLSKITLSKIAIDTKGFANALLKMVELRDLELNECNFTESCQFVSDNVENLKMNFQFNDRSVLLPHFPKLKTLSFAYLPELHSTFVQICDFYPKLEQLYFSVLTEYKVICDSSTCFSSIKKLKFLRDLHIVGLDFHDTIWTECNDVKVVNLHLHDCKINGNVAQQLVASIGHGLRNLLLHKCYLDMNESCIENLCNSLLWCKISFKDCHIIDVMQPSNRIVYFRIFNR